MARRSGFTLIEVIAAAAISTVIVSAVFVSAFSIMRVWREIEQKSDSLGSARISLSRISAETRNSLSVTPASNEHILILNCGGDVISYDLYEGKVRRRVNASASYLTEAGRVASLKFSYPSARLVSVTIGVSIGFANEIVTTECFVRN